MADQTNEEIARQLVEALWNGELDAAHPHPGYWQTLHTFQLVREAFPDLSIAIQRQLSVDDTVVSQIDLVGTHRADFLGTPPTGSRVKWTIVYVDRFEDGKVVEHVSGDGWMDMLMTIGAVRPPG